MPKEQILMCHRKNGTTRPQTAEKLDNGVSAQGASLNVPQEEMVLNVPKRRKNEKIGPVPALINSLYGTFGKRTVFGNLWGGRPHGAVPHKKNCF